MLLAVDFSNEYLNILKLKKEEHNFRIDTVYTESLSACVTNKKKDYNRLLKQIIQEYHLEDDKIITFIPAEETYVKFFDIPCVSSKELKANIEMKLLNLLGNSSEKIRFNYQILEKTNSNDYKILCVVIKEDVLMRYMEPFTGLEVATVDSGYFALQNCFELNYPEYVSKRVALIDFYNTGVHILVCKNGKSEFCSDIDLTENLSKAALEQNYVEKISGILIKQLKQIEDIYNNQEKIELLFISGIFSDSNLMLLKESLENDLSTKILEPFRFLTNEGIAKINNFKNFATHNFIRCVGGAIRTINDDCSKDNLLGSML